MRGRLLVAAFSLCLASAALADGVVTGTVTKIVGQRVTLVDAKGKQTTLTIPQIETLKLGEKVSVEYKVVGDALRASAVKRLP